VLFEWRNDGFFRASRSKNLWVKGVASDIEVVAELLKRSGVLRTSQSVYRARPNREVRDWGWMPAAAARDAQDIGQELDYQVGPGRPEGIASQLVAIARDLPERRDELEELARARARRLNHVAPQVHWHRLFMHPCDDEDNGERGVAGSACRGWGLWTDWVDPSLIPITLSPRWNNIDRDPRRSTVVNVAEWLRGASELSSSIDQWLKSMFTEEPIPFKPIYGPAGPIYQVDNGTHRAHAARIWGLPRVLARVMVDLLPIPLNPVCGRDLTPLWTGLRRRGLLQADVDDGSWYLWSVAAEWMLTPPAPATQMNAAYERIYPGALQTITGMTLTELTHAESWEHALTSG